jgi:hemoglobin
MNAPLTLRGTPVPQALDEALIRIVVLDFYGKVRADDILGPIFDTRIAPDAWPPHLQRMCDFWSSVLLRTGRYSGQPLLPHLEIDEIVDETFERWLTLFRQSVETACDPDSAGLFMEMAQRIARSFRMALAAHRGESPADWPGLRREPASPGRETASGHPAHRSGEPGASAPSIDDGGDLRSHLTGRAGRPA